MSYEGYVEHLCEAGHLWVVDAYAEVQPECCPRCGRGSAFRHAVDVTNGVVYLDDGSEDPGTVPYPFEVDHYEEVVRQVPIYRVPSAPGSHVHSDACWEPDSGCDLGRSAAHAARSGEP